jgi:F0F1-type ATP synthase membrane subunit b/b'
MSDVLERLLAVEKDAAALVAQAEAEAARRRAAAQARSADRAAEAVKAEAVRAAERIAAAKEEIAAERERRSRAHGQSLAARPRDTQALRRVVEEFVDKGL